MGAMRECVYLVEVRRLQATDDADAANGELIRWLELHS